MHVPAGCPCLHLFVYIERPSQLCVCVSVWVCAHVCVCVGGEGDKIGREWILTVESNNSAVFDHMIPYISSVGSWTVSTAHNNNNMFQMNPTPHYCQRLAANPTPGCTDL